MQSIALENLCSRVSSYLYIGASIQIAYSLGLHRDQTPETGASSEREQHRRIWWTLFMLDQEIASRGGTPNVIDERSLKIDTPLPSEQVIIAFFPQRRQFSYENISGLVSWNAYSTRVVVNFSLALPP